MNKERKRESSRRAPGCGSGIQSDCHMHTEFSTDSEASVKSMLDAAAACGLDAVCITDHMDLDFPPQESEVIAPGETPFWFDADAYFRTLAPLREAYRGRLDVRIGMEIGLQPHLGERYRELVQRYPFDYVIGSVHLIRGLDPYYGKLLKGGRMRKPIGRRLSRPCAAWTVSVTLTRWAIWIMWCATGSIRQRSIHTGCLPMRSTPS